MKTACHLFLMKKLSDTSFVLVLLSYFAEKVDQVVTFRQMNVASSTTSKALTTTTRLKNISSTRISYPHHMFIPHLAQ
jgi:hypothetical protein